MIDVEKISNRFAEEIMDIGYFYPKNRNEDVIYFKECEIEGETVYFYGYYWRLYFPDEDKTSSILNNVPLNVDVEFSYKISQYSLEISIRFHCRGDAGETNLLFTPNNELELSDEYKSEYQRESRCFSRTITYLVNVFRSKLVRIIDETNDESESEYCYEE